MALNIHTDTRFEKYLDWLARQSGKTKTDVVKDLVYEKYRLKKTGFRFGTFKSLGVSSSEELQDDLKSLDQDHDLD